jgi:hypothetical protein
LNPPTTTAAATIGKVVTETPLVLFTLIFFLHGGPGVWQFLLGVVPDEVRTRVDVAGRRGVAALVSYVRATAVVAVVEAVAIGIGLPRPVSRWPCRWPLWCSSARSCPSSARSWLAGSRC